MALGNKANSKRKDLRWRLCILPLPSASTLGESFPQGQAAKHLANFQKLVRFRPSGNLPEGSLYSGQSVRSDLHGRSARRADPRVTCPKVASRLASESSPNTFGKLPKVIAASSLAPSGLRPAAHSPALSPGNPAGRAIRRPSLSAPSTRSSSARRARSGGPHEEGIPTGDSDCCRRVLPGRGSYAPAPRPEIPLVKPSEN